jgi:hypothetical protein
MPAPGGPAPGDPVPGGPPGPPPGPAGWAPPGPPGPPPAPPGPPGPGGWGPPQPPKSKGSGLVVAAVLGIVLVLAVGVGVFVLSGDDDSERDGPVATEDASGDDGSNASPPSEPDSPASTTSTAPDAVASGAPETVVVEMLTVPACADSRHHVAEASLPSFDAGCTDGAVDAPPSVEVLENDGSEAVLMVTYSVGGTSRTDEVRLIAEGGSWKVNVWTRPDGTPWIHPS